MKSVQPDLNALANALPRARLMLKRYREEQAVMVEQYVGLHWGPEGAHARQAVPVNLLSLYCSVVGRNLIAKNPRVLLSTTNRAAKPTVAAMQDWANKEIERTYLARTLEGVVLDSLFSLGVCKVALADPSEAAMTGWSLRAGYPFARRIQLPHLVLDMHATTPEELAFIGHRYRVPLDTVRGSKLYGREGRELSPMPDLQFNAEGDELLNVLGRGYYDGGAEESEQYVYLWEIYLPRHRLVMTLAADQSGNPSLSRGKALRVQRWLGPDCGPYHLLSMASVPGNIMPKAPLQDLFDLHLSINRLYRKVIRQAERNKELTTYKRQHAEDAERVRTGNDGDLVGVDDPEAIKPVVTGNINQPVFVLVDSLRKLYSDLGGNLDLLAGSGPQSKTAAQDEMLMSSASSGIASMQQRTTDLTVDVVRAMCWFWHHHPSAEYSAPYSVPGSDFSVPRSVGPADRQQVPYDDLDVQVDPYSLLRQTPQQRAQALLQIVQEFTPLMPLLQGQGINFDMNALLTKMAAYLDMPDLPEIMTIQEPPPPEESTVPGGTVGVTGPTKRTYERVSRSANTEGNEHQTLVNSLQAAGAMGQPNGMVNKAG